VEYTPQGHTSRESSDKGERTYGYNAAERLIRYASTAESQNTPSIEAQYRYDPLGRRISKEVKEGQATKITYFFYSDTGLLGEANEQGQMTRTYAFDPQKAQRGLWSTDPIWQAEVSEAQLAYKNASAHYLHTDHLGTPLLGTNKQGVVMWRDVKEAFGAAGILPKSQLEMNLRFPGQYFDFESEENYNFQRNYKSGVGRYLQADFFGLNDGSNVYVYARQNALSYMDFNGNWAFVGKCLSDPACSGMVLTGLAVVYQGCKAIVNTVVLSVDSEWWRNKETDKARDNQEVHNICDNQKNDNRPQTCEWAKERLRIAIECYNARKNGWINIMNGTQGMRGNWRLF
jgi:RHS repeat-associated protein